MLAVTPWWGFGREAAAGNWCRLGWRVLGQSSRLARAPGTFQSSASALILKASKSVSVLFKSRVSVSYSLLVSPTGFQNQEMGLIFLVLDPRVGVPNVGLKLSLLREYP